MNWALLQNSLAVAGAATVIAVGLGLVCALWLAGLPAPGRALFLAAAIVALALPPFLVTNCWLHYLGHTGVWHSWLPLSLFSRGGAVWVLSLLLWPVSLLLVWGAWQRLEPAQLESDLQVRGWALLRVLLLPLARGALIQAALVTFVLALNNFAVPAILQVKVFPAEMWVRFNTSFDTLGALQLSWPLILCPLLLLLWSRQREVPWPHRQAPVTGRLFRQQLGPGWFYLSGVAAILVCAGSTALPLVQILSQPRTWTELPGALAASQGAVWHSFWYAAGAATAICALALWGVGLAESPRVKASRAWAFGFQVLTGAGWLAFLAPGVLLGIGLIHVFNHTWTALFYQSSGIVILAFGIRYLAVGWFGASRAGQKIDRDLLDMARLEGATRWQMLRHVVWPQMARPLALMWYVVYVLCLWDAESMILVVPPGGETLALRVFNLLHYGHNAQVNALCFSLLAVALTPLLLERVFFSARKLRRFRAPGLATVTLAGGLVLLQTSCSPSKADLSLHSRFFERVEIIGTRGVGVGQLNKPRSVAVDLADNLYVVDMTGRVQKFSTNGTFLLSWQMPEIERGKPKGMGHDRQGNILVVEPHYSRVNLFSPQGKLLSQWGSHGTNHGQFSLPRGVTVNSKSQIFVSEYEESERVQRFEFAPGALSPQAQRTSAGLCRPPEWTGVFGRPGNGPGEFNRAEGLCVDGQDRIYVADSCNHRIQIFSSDGKFLRSYGKPGRGLGELSYPYDICVDQAGHQYVCEFGNSRIQVFDAEDRPIEIIGGPGAGPGQFSNPWSLALDSAGNLYVADSQNHRVQKLIRKE